MKTEVDRGVKCALAYALIVLSITLAGCARAPNNPPSESAGRRASLAIRGATLLDPGTGEVSEASSLLLDGDRIVAAGTESEVAIPDGVEVIEAAGLYVIPGLWDLHTHLTMLGDNTPPLLVTQGVTGVRDLGAVPEAIEELRRRIAMGELLGPTIVRAGPTLNGAQNDGHHRVIDSPEDARRAVADLRAAGFDLVKTHNATRREVYFALLEAAREAGLVVAGHVPTQISPSEACEAGQASIEHIATLFEGTYISRFESEIEAFQGMAAWEESEGPALADCFARQQTLFVPTLRAYELQAHSAAAYDDPDPRLRYLSREVYDRWRTDWVPFDTDRLPEVIALRQGLVDVGLSFVARFYAAGAPIGAGTDLAPTGLLPGFDLHREIELLTEAGLPPHAALWAAARGPGANAGGQPLTGRLIAGAPADLVLLRAHAFDDVAALSQIEAVILRGVHYDRAALDAVLADLER
jgi:imidazolonepropionase-like amidohydrolase